MLAGPPPLPETSLSLAELSYRYIYRLWIYGEWGQDEYQHRVVVSIFLTLTNARNMHGVPRDLVLVLLDTKSYCPLQGLRVWECVEYTVVMSK